MNVLTKLTIDSLKKNRRRTIVTIIGVTLSSALILAVGSMASSFHQMLINENIKKVGDYHEMYENVPSKSIQYITKNVGVSSYYFASPLDYSTLDGVEEFYQQYIHYPFDSEYVQKQDEIGTADQYNVFVRYKNVNDYENVRENLLYVLKEQTGENINYRTNADLLQYEGVFGDATAKSIYLLCAFVVGVIIITSIFSIRNSFSISANERAKQFGMLASIGATPKQIRHTVLVEGGIIGLIGTLLGIALGVLASVILILVVNSLAANALSLSIRLHMPDWLIPATIILSLLTVLISAYLPARRASKVSPIESIRGDGNVKINPKKIKVSRLTFKLFGIGGVIAAKNLKRSRRKYRTTVISIVLSVATFIGLSTFVDTSFKSVKVMYRDITYNFYAGNGSNEIFSDVTKKFGFEDYAYYNYSDIEEGQFLFMNQDSFVKFAKSIGITSPDYQNLIILNDREITGYPDGHSEFTRKYTDKKDGDIITVSSYVSKDEYAPLSLKVTKFTDRYPIGFEMSSTPVFIVSEHFAGLEQSGFFDLFAKVDDPASLKAFLEETYPEVTAENTEEIMKIVSNIYLLVAIFLYGFIFVVTLIGITSVFNTITTNIALRSKEFAMLRSVGMTDREFNHMIRLESLMYSFKAYIIGLPLGLLLSYGIYKSFSFRLDFGYSLPLIQIIISVLSVAVLIWAIMTYSVRKVNQQNIIETIRKDNI